MRHRLIATAILSIMASLYLHAEFENRWRRTLGFNEYIVSIAVDPHNSESIFCCTNYDVFHSTDEGETWTSCGLETGSVSISPYSITVDPGQAGVIYVGTTGGTIFKSSDGGASWMEISLGLSHREAWGDHVWEIEVHPDDSQVVFAVSYQDGLYKSTNGGQLWRMVKAGNFKCMAIDPNNPSVIFVGGDWHRFEKSTDAGENWTWTAEGQPQGPVSDLVIDPTEGQSIFAGTSTGLYQSTDGGHSWSLNSFQYASIYPVIGHPAPPYNMYLVVYPGLLYRSTDHGRNWSYLSASFKTDRLALHPWRPHELYVGRAGTGSQMNLAGLARSTDDGRTWTRLARQGIPDARVYALAADPLSEGVLLAGTHTGIVRSVDGGLTWQAASGDLPASPVESIVVSKSNPMVIYAYLTDHGIYRSQNGGLNWVLRNSGLGNQYVWTIAIDPTNPDIVMVSNDSIYKTLDGGLTWTEKRIEESSYNVDGILFDPVDPNRVFAWTHSMLARSTNQGESWDIRYGFGSLTMDPFDHMILYAGQYSGIFKSTNGGDDWESMPEIPLDGELKALQSDPQDSRTIWGIKGNHIIRTTNGGRTWHGMNDGFPAVNPRTILPDLIAAGVYYAYTYADIGIFRIECSDPLDLNLDGMIDTLDAVVLVGQLSENQYSSLPPTGLDLNGDGRENIIDLVWLEHRLVGDIPKSPLAMNNW